MNSKLVTVRRFPGMVHADLAKSALAAAEIDAAIIDGVRVGYGTIDLMVREQDVDAALGSPWA